MKRLFGLIAASAILLGACGTDDNTENTTNTNTAVEENTADTNTTTNEEAGNEEPANENESNEAANGTVTYESESGPIEVPADPQRVVVLATFAGNAMALDANLVGVDSWAMSNPEYSSYLDGVEAVDETNVESVLELEPDLIIGLSTTENIDQFSQIAPTVTYTYGELDYKEQHIEIGKLLNKEDEAREWVEDYEARAQAAGDSVREEIGEDTTVTVVENFDKQLYIFGDNFARGTEILYQEMELEMPEAVQDVVSEDGFYAISTEVLSEYVGDYLVISQPSDQESEYQQTETYQSIPAVQNGNVIEFPAESGFFNDPITIDLLLGTFEEAFLN
ncbi:iron-hydroxamate ABC transporter substrate-binding protein [Paenalkalicoccus suaedae]|uniref:Iron-hydroxamate ABC transporter substrate-binding protein n=1 Tax=Paenalkalicoccus suaedae TaxID=2592382 RepID=A0A859FDF0_9BACI|nr:iron-hydroxamate ABC transporter substrate-binding protein [Paenalkalicoccus suaedae]QKS70604.1 iron-hydroxamate ABC transporter substrate-binding protein [Paenalkalicoccus suaedae]